MRKETRNFWNYAVAFVLAIGFIVPTFLPMSAYATEGVAPIVEETIAPITVQQKMDQLLQKLGVSDGKTVYFTVNQTACLAERVSAKDGGHGCNNCHTDYITQAEWFKNLFGIIDTANFPSHNSGKNWAERYERGNTGKSCFGWACFAQWYLYADTASEKLTGECVATVTFNKTNMMTYVQPGDVIRVGGHSVLVYSVEEDGLVVLDSNWNMGKQLNCVVQKHSIGYNHIDCYGKTAFVNRVTKTATMEYGMAGMFDVVGNGVNVEQNTDVVIPNEPTVVKTYGTLNLSGTGWSRYNVGQTVNMYADRAYPITHGSRFEILGKYTNANNREVYHVYSYDLAMECYVSAKYVTLEDAVVETETYGTLDLSSTGWVLYNVGQTVNMYADRAYPLANGARLKILGKYTNANNKEVYHVYSYDLDMECYITAKYVKVN